MTLLLDLAARVTVPLLLGILACRLLRRRSAASRHGVLSVSLLAALVVLPLTAIAPSWELPFSYRRTPAAPVHADADQGPRAEIMIADATAGSSTLPSEPGPAARTDADAPIALPAIFLAVWAAGVAVGLSRMAAGVVQLRRVIARARPAAGDCWTALAMELSVRFGIGRRVDVLVTDTRGVLATWGFIRPQVLLPADAVDWTNERRRLVLAHELAHIRRADWLVQIVADAFRTLLWFNPVLWIAADRLRRESEQACDDEVLRMGVEPGTYASHLLDLARHRRATTSVWAATLSMARSSTLEWRIAAMLNVHLNRTIPSRVQIAAAFAALAIVAVPASTLRLSAQDVPAPLTGAVYDVTGAVLPDVAITVEDQQQVRQATRSDPSGRFEFAAMSPGTYTLRTEVPGFRALTTTFELRTPGDWQRTITLQVGELQETVRVSAPRPATSRSTGAATEPVRVGGNIRAPRKLSHVRPVYPQAMQEAGLQGVVPLEALIARDGSVSSVWVLSAQVHPEFAAAAARAVSQWRFSPTLLNGTPVEVQMTVTVLFNLAENP
jgi:TonB family protein